MLSEAPEAHWHCARRLRQRSEGIIGRKKSSYYDLHDSTIPKPWLQHKGHEELRELFVDVRLVFSGRVALMLCFRRVIGVKLLGDVFPALDGNFSSTALTLNDKVWFYMGTFFGLARLFFNSKYEAAIANSG